MFTDDLETWNTITTMNEKSSEYRSNMSKQQQQQQSIKIDSTVPYL